MINTRIAYKNSDGGVSIVCPSPEFCADPTNDLALLVKRSVPLEAEYQVLSAQEVSSDRYYRNAWRLVDGIEIDDAQARGIHTDKLRVIRDEKLKAEDIEYQKALEMRDDAKMNVIANKKKKLRDMPLDDKLNSLPLDELKNYIPEILI